MTRKMLPPTQSAVDEAALEGAQLALQQQDRATKNSVGRKASLLKGITFLSTVSFYAGPLLTEGWKK